MQKIRIDELDKNFGRKWTKCHNAIFAHSLGNIMGEYMEYNGNIMGEYMAIVGLALAPMFLHPLQYGGRNIGKAYPKQELR